MIKTIVKRDGITVPFNEEKITNAISYGAIRKEGKD